MYKVYILKSEKFLKYYIGHTEDLENRLKKHNKGDVRSTKNAKPWMVVYIEVFNTREKACEREKKIKSYKGGQAFENLIK